MRRYAHCLILLMMPFAASATAALDDSRGACVSSNGDAASQRAPTATASAATTKPAPVRPAASSATSTGGGGSDDDVLQRIRAPKWQLPAGNVPLIKSLLQWLRPSPRPIDDALWEDACRRAAWLHGLDDERRARLRVLATRFLHEDHYPCR